MLTKRMASEIAGFRSPREQLFALLRAYIDHGVENPALYSLMFGGYLTGPNHGRPAIELAAAEKTKALLAGVIIAGGSDALSRTLRATNERSPVRFWRAGPSCTDSRCCSRMASSARIINLARWLTR
jgi:hypothetical protein